MLIVHKKTGDLKKNYYPNDELTRFIQLKN